MQKRNPDGQRRRHTEPTEQASRSHTAGGGRGPHAHPAAAGPAGKETGPQNREVATRLPAPACSAITQTVTQELGATGRVRDKGNKTIELTHASQPNDATAISPLTHFTNISLQLCVHFLGFDKIFSRGVQVLLQLCHVTGEGGQTLLHLALLPCLLVDDFLQLDDFGEVFLVA